MDSLIDSKRFETNTLLELKKEVEEYVRQFVSELEQNMGISDVTTGGNKNTQ